MIRRRDGRRGFQDKEAKSGRVCIEKTTGYSNKGIGFQDKEETRKRNRGGALPPPTPPPRAAPLDPPLYFRTCAAMSYPDFVQRRNRTRVLGCDSSKCSGSG